MKSNNIITLLKDSYFHTYVKDLSVHPRVYTYVYIYILTYIYI